MSEAPDLREVDELIASMEPRPKTPQLNASTTPSTSPHSALPELPALVAPPAQETDRKKPTTPQLTPRRSDRSGSSGNSSFGNGTPIVVGNNEAPLVTAKASPASSPRVSAVFANTTPRSTIAASDAPCDLDALAELLRSESQTLSTYQEPRETTEDRSSLTELGDKHSVLPPLLSGSQKSLSFAAPHGHSKSAGARRSTMLQKQASLSLMGQPPDGEAVELSPRLLYSPRSATMLNKQNASPSRRRLTIGTHEISHHALERLGVNTDILKKEKGMKKLGISDLDIERFEEIRRYSGVPHSVQPVTKVEFMFGFTREQLQRVKAINRLGTSEEEVQDEYSRRISRLGVHDVPIAQN